MVHPAGLPPANSPFEAEDDHNFTTDAEAKDEGRMTNDELGRGSFFIHISSFQTGGLPRIRTEFSPVKSRDFTLKVCNPCEHEGGVEPPRPDL